jgi:hypothetical protein
MAMKEEGFLTGLTLAWSRDGKEKIYVQDRMRERGAELFAWLEQGAHFYVCGDAKRMAKDVERALVDVVAEHGGVRLTRPWPMSPPEEGRALSGRRLLTAQSPNAERPTPNLPSPTNLGLAADCHGSCSKSETSDLDWRGFLAPRRLMPRPLSAGLETPVLIAQDAVPRASARKVGTGLRDTPMQDQSPAASGRIRYSA